MVGIIRYFKGYVKIRVSGFSPERFMNLCGNHGILLWNVKRDRKEYTMFIHLSDIWELRPIARKTGTRVVVLKRYGLPFFIPHILHRKTLVLGCTLMVVALIISSHYIWKIQYEGNVKITDDAMEYLLKQQDIRIGSKRKSVNLMAIENMIRNSFPEITWVSVRLDGTKLQITIKENDAPLVEEDLGTPEGVDLISKYDGTIVSIVVRRGVPNITAGKEVRAGDVLVYGQVPVYQEDGTVKGYQMVDPQAEIWMEHEIAYEYRLPFFHQYQEYTGREEKDHYVRVGNMILGGIKMGSFLNYDSIRKESSLSVFEKLSIPIYFGSIIHREYHFLEQEYPLQEAERLLNEEILKFTEGLKEKGVHILEKNVTIETTIDGWSVTGEFLVLERIFSTD